MTNYKNLELWRLSMEIVKETYQLTRNYPSEEKYGLISQTNRAVVSIACNIAEGMGRNHVKDTVQFLHVSRGSAYEAETLLSIARMLKIIDEEASDNVEKKLERSIQMINGLINYLEKKS
jgi:four helix bundle protein